MRSLIISRRSITLAAAIAATSLGTARTASAQPALATQPPLAAQSAPAPAYAEDVRPGEQVFQILGGSSTLSLVELQSRIVELQSRIKVVDGFDQTVVNVTALDPRRLRLRALKPGVTTLTLTDEFGASYSIELFVEGDIRELQAHLRRLFPGSAIEAIKMRDSIVLQGWVTQPDQIPQVIAITEQFAPKVHNHMAVAGENLVQLNVKVMEVQRTKLQRYGFNFLAVGQQYYVASNPGSLVPIQSVTLPFGGPPTVLSQAAALASPTIQFAITGTNDIFQGFIESLQQKSLLKILAEPKLVTTSGRPASLLSGGEFPILVPQGLGTATIEWREFGVRMEAVPIVLGNGRLRLDIAPEVSDRDFSNAVNLNGTVVPGLTTRRVNTQVEMRFGDTLMIGGLISTRKNGNKSEIPVLGELPIIGAAFRRVSYEDAETELLVLVTPYLVSPLGAEQVPPGGPGLNSVPPTPHELFFDGNLEVDHPGYGQSMPPYCPPGMIGPGPGMAPSGSGYTPSPAAPPAAMPMAPPPPAASGEPMSANSHPTRAAGGSPPGLILPTSATTTSASSARPVRPN